MNASDQRRWLVIGCGSIGRRHIGNLLALNAGEVIGCDTRPERRAETTSQHGVTCVASLDEAWALLPEVALITTPTSLHLRLAITAAERGCHLFIEKPLADQWDGTEQLVQLVREKNLVTLVGCNMRFHPGLRAVQRLLTEGAVGRVTAARFEMGQHLPDWHPQEDYRQNYSARRDLGGGVILDAIHELDYARWLLGEVSAVTCFAGKTSSLEIETEDTAEILLRFTSGTIGEVHLDYVQRAHRRTCQIIGEEGTIHWDYGAGRVNWFSARTRSWSELLNPPGWQPNQMYVDEMRHFIACLDGKEASQLDVSQARRVLQIALAAKEASATGQTVTWGNA
jgi:predicted dehydrogenase